MDSHHAITHITSPRITPWCEGTLKQLPGIALALLA